MQIVYFLAPLLLGAVIILTACKKQPEPHALKSHPNMLSFTTQPIQTFALTAQDHLDLALLEGYKHQFNQINILTESDLQNLPETRHLNDHFVLKRKYETIHIALKMIQKQPLNTPQGRYIQNLMYRYWKEQERLFFTYTHHQKVIAVEDIPLHGIADLLHAHEQLIHWQTQYLQTSKAMHHSTY